MGKYIWGFDPASVTDYFGSCCHDISSGMPRLVYLDRWKGSGYDQMIHRIRFDFFVRFPPFYVVTDYSNERTLTDILIKLYGKHKIEPVKYTIPNKKMLKDDGYSIFKQGYKFPNPNNQQEPQRTLLAELMGELQREQLLITKSGKETFDHPPGQHNDLAAAWELSIHGCSKFLLKRGGLQAVTRKWGPEINNMIDEGVKSPKYTISRETYYPGEGTSI